MEDRGRKTNTAAILFWTEDRGRKTNDAVLRPASSVKRQIKSTRGAAAVRIAWPDAACQTAAISCASVASSAATSALALGCSPSLTISARRVAGPTVERRLWRKVQRRA